MTKRDRHVQLINTTILDKTTQARSKAMEKTRQHKALKRDQWEKQKLHDYLQAERKTNSATSTHTLHEVIIEVLHYKVL